MYIFYDWDSFLTDEDEDGCSDVDDAAVFDDVGDGPPWDWGGRVVFLFSALRLAEQSNK